MVDKGGRTSPLVSFQVNTAKDASLPKMQAAYRRGQRAAVLLRLFQAAEGRHRAR